MRLPHKPTQTQMLLRSIYGDSLYRGLTSLALACWTRANFPTDDETREYRRPGPHWFVVDWVGNIADKLAAAWIRRPTFKRP